MEAVDRGPDPPFWIDQLVALIAGFAFVGGVFLRGLLVELWLLAGSATWYGPTPDQRHSGEHASSALFGLGLVAIAPTLWGCRELWRGRRAGLWLAVAVGLLALVAVLRDRSFAVWIVLIPLPLYGAARLAGYGPRPV